MAKVGQIVTIPTGSYCNVTLDSGEKIVVSHEAGAGGGAGARLRIDRLKLMGFSSETVVEIDLDTLYGSAALAELTSEATLGEPRSPIRALVAFVRACPSVAEVVARCNRLLQRR
jgi:hypothetical protein